MSRKRTGPKLLNTSRMRANSSSALQLGQQEFSATVIDLSHSGEAIVEHPQGLKVFVPGAWLDEDIKVRILGVKKHFAKGRLLEVLRPSPHRRPAPCKFHGNNATQCGGCPWMFADYAAQCEAKQRRVEQALGKVAPDCQVLPIITAPHELAYRVRAQLKSDGEHLGFVSNGQRAIVNISTCPVLSEKNQETVKQLIHTLPNRNWRPKQSKHRWSTLDIDENTDAASVSVNKRLPFQQANAQQNQHMKLWIANKLEQIGPRVKALELFAGSGNFTEVLAAAEINEVIAIEVVQAAIDELNDLQLTGVKAIAADLFDEKASAKILREHNDAELLVLDPPRDGMKLKIGLFGKRSKIKDVLYISCDLATFSRDLTEFQQNGFKLIELQPLDLMPQTAHVELMAHIVHDKKPK